MKNSGPGVYMTPGQLSHQSEFTLVPSHGSTVVYMIAPQNVMPTRITPGWVYPSCCIGARISHQYEISQRYHVNAKRPHISVWNRSTGRLEQEAKQFFIWKKIKGIAIWLLQCTCVHVSWNTDVYNFQYIPLFIKKMLHKITIKACPAFLLLSLVD